MEQHKTIVFEGHTLHYRDEGREHTPTLVLLHGYMQSLDIWSSYILSYMRNMHVLSVDLPGHGYSETFGDVHTMDFMATAVKAVLDDAGEAVEPVVYNTLLHVPEIVLSGGLVSDLF